MELLKLQQAQKCLTVIALMLLWQFMAITDSAFHMVEQYQEAQGLAGRQVTPIVHTQMNTT
jgi:hypothetical protein